MLRAHADGPTTHCLGDAHSREGVSLGLGGTLRGGVHTPKCSSGLHGDRDALGDKSIKDGNSTLTGGLWEGRRHG